MVHCLHEAAMEPFRSITPVSISRSGGSGVFCTGSAVRGSDFQTACGEIDGLIHSEVTRF